MDLNSALHTARCGGYVRDDATMAPDWKVCFLPHDTPLNHKLARAEQSGCYIYVDPKGEQAHAVRFSDAMKASYQWRTVL